MSTSRPILLTAGGTGGHLFPAEALASVLLKRGFKVELVTDDRASRYADSFPAPIHAVASATIVGRSPVSLLKAAMKLGLGTGESLALMRSLKPAAVVGFGGYPTLPPLGAALLLRIPTVIHEANAVMGRANRLVAGRVNAIATGFPKIKNLRPADEAKAVHTGNPVRPAVLAAARPYAPSLPGQPFRIVAFGGSQGARVMSEVVPAALASLEPRHRARIQVVQQAREEDIGHVEVTYHHANIASNVAPFFKNLPASMADAHVVIARSGASTVAELCVIGRPSILVPLPHALDNDQLENARALAEAGGTTIMTQDAFTPAALAAHLVKLMDDPVALAQQAFAAESIARPDAAERLADLVLARAGLAPAPASPSSPSAS